MKIIICHNFYQQAGGEDQVFAEEAELLERYGHAVVRFTLHNDAIKGEGGSLTAVDRLRLMGDTFWNRGVYRRLKRVVRDEGADVVHFHNTFPLMSPAAYYAARRGGAAVVQTLHNYRLLCPNGMFFRNGSVCEQCLGRTPWPALVHNCYRGSRAASGTAAAMLTAHRAAGTYRAAVDLYVALTEFGRNKFIKGGLPADKIAVKPNFVGADRGAGDGAGNFALFVGRLDAGKGLDVLLKAWSKLPAELSGHTLKILGDGPLAPPVREAVAKDPRIEWLGRRPLDEVYETMGQAAFLVVSSTWYEGLPRTIVESFSKGTPVIAAKLGALAELVRPGETGLHFEPGNPDDLARQIAYAFSRPVEWTHFRRHARLEYETKYTAAENYRQMLSLYERAVQNRSRQDRRLRVG